MDRRKWTGNRICVFAVEPTTKIPIIECFDFETNEKGIILMVKKETLNHFENTEFIKILQKDIPVLTAQIQNLYAELDRKFHLNAAKVPITFGYEQDSLGSYTRAGNGEEEHFHFSLLFAGYAVEHPLSKEDRLDLFKHEYAHYMQYNMEIPKQYDWQPGIHGSAWKYCCSLIGAAPTPYYKAGEALLKHDYDKVLKNPIHDKTIPIRDTYRRERQYQDSKNSVVQYQIGEKIKHPKFGEGSIENIEQMSGSVRLHIRFKEELKVIDQKWLLRTKYQRGGNNLSHQ